MDPKIILSTAAAIIDKRGENYGGIEQNFDRAAAIASARLNKVIHPYEVCVILASVKAARMAQTPNHPDSTVDAINYEAFAAQFAAGYVEFLKSQTV